MILDEAHKAQGSHPYVQAVEAVSKMTRHFRVVGLSASPGASLDVVQKLVENLHISKVEVRSDSDPDVAPYIHSRSEELITVAPDDNLTRVQRAFEKVMWIPLNKLSKSKIINVRSIQKLSSFILLRLISNYSENTSAKTLDPDVVDDLYILVSLYKAYENLMSFGVRAFYSVVLRIFAEKKSSPSVRSLFSSPYWSEAVEEARSILRSLPKTTGSHPKIEKLKEVIFAHFQSLSERSTRVIIFSRLRESVM